MANDSNCGCNPFPPCNQSTKAVCGEFDVTTATPDLGACAPISVKIDCDRPAKPQNPCNDESAYAEYNADLSPPFRIITSLHDENCEQILDETNAPILTPVY